VTKTHFFLARLFDLLADLEARVMDFAARLEDFTAFRAVFFTAFRAVFFARDATFFTAVASVLAVLRVSLAIAFAARLTVAPTRLVEPVPWFPLRRGALTTSSGALVKLPIKLVTASTPVASNSAPRPPASPAASAARSTTLEGSGNRAPLLLSAMCSFLPGLWSN
jgi:hypothetical protein